MDLSAPFAVPYSAALLILVLLVAVEVIGVLIGFVPSAMLDSALPDMDLGADAEMEAGAGPLDADAPSPGDTPGGLSKFLAWLSVGKVPVLVLLMVFLAAFGLIGLTLQTFAIGALGTALPNLIVGPASVIASLYPVKWIGGAIGKLLPKEHSEASSSEDFIGRVATITAGTARQGLPAEAKLKDSFGQAHYVRVEPDLDEDTFTQGTEVLLTSKAGATYRAIELTSEYLR